MKTNIIQVLVDNDSWILPFASNLIDQLATLGYQAQLRRKAQDITPGWTVFILGCIHIIPKAILSRNQHNLVVHESALPQGKGFSPMSWQILSGINKIPVCLIEAAEEIDAGDIWLTDTIHLNGNELHYQWRNLQGEKTIELCLKFIKNYHCLKPQKQQGNASFYPRRTPKDSQLDINKSIKEQFNLLRVVDNEKYPAFFEYNGQRFKLMITKDE